MGIIKSNVVEFVQPFFDKNLQKEEKGRIYFTRSYYDDSNNLVRKPDEIVNLAIEIFTKVKSMR